MPLADREVARRALSHLRGSGLLGRCTGSSAANTYARQRALATWPVKGMIQPDAFINSAFPVGWQESGLTVEQQQERVVDVWAHAADGHFDHLWREPLIAIRNALTFEGLGSTLVVLRPWWEGNKAATWGENHSIFSVSYASAIRPATALADRDVVKAAFRRYADVAHDVWPNYLLHFNPHKDNTKTQPTAVKITTGGIRPHGTRSDPIPMTPAAPSGELYNNGSNLERWNAWADKENSYGPVGVGKWLAWARANGTAPASDQAVLWRVGLLRGRRGHRPGGDNPLYIQKMFDHFGDAAASGNMGYEVYFNSSTHLLTPVGGAHRCPTRRRPIARNGRSARYAAAEAEGGSTDGRGTCGRPSRRPERLDWASTHHDAPVRRDHDHRSVVGLAFKPTHSLTGARASCSGWADDVDQGRPGGSPAPGAAPSPSSSGSATLERPTPKASATRAWSVRPKSTEK